jgi:transposase
VRGQYRAYAKAKRTFTSCIAKLKNLVKDLHYKTCAYLTEHYDVILLPIFKTKGMFTCPFCAYRAGRDENAALHILRYVCAGSLQVQVVE